MASRLQLFDKFVINNEKRQQVAIDPKRVTFARQTAHGSVFLGYNKDFGFDVVGEIAATVEKLNQGRGE
ncbi:hypothetical protein LJD47_28610 [Escherichia coli]|nr:hypothetical protein [Escherichia coli]